jgi:small-conductance mechanosensitive channel
MAHFVRWLHALPDQSWFLPGAVLTAIGLYLLCGLVFNHRRWRDSIAVQSLSSVVRGLVFWGPVLFALHADSYRSQRFSKDPSLWVTEAALLAFTGALTVSAVRGIARGFRVYRRRFPDLDPGHRNRVVVLRKLSVGVVLTLGAMAALGVLGVDPGPLLAGGAVGGVVLGLALQESLSAVFAGLFLTWDASVRIGDTIRLPAGQEGVVESVGWRNTQIRLPDQTLLVVPNGTLATSIVANLSRPSPETSIVLDAAVAYGSDLARVEETVLREAKAVQRLYSGEDPGAEPVLRWRELGENGVTFRAFVPVARQTDVYCARSDFVRALHDAFRVEGISVPPPQREVTIRGAAGP